ncbi:MAG: VacJ family lipoprotein [Gammaproteobacteria bacterium]|nr:VacJ family lipoprotein [Gammaproteobacteria bacterium]MDH5629918.1 VacJ family lipoprotein [Gammaproteobacteria bacterium]
MKGLKLIFFSLFFFLTGCASTGNNAGSDQETSAENKDDPWENWNRGVYSFNKVMDENIAKPATNVYKAITPDFMETGFSNVFSNLGDVSNMVNNLLQGKLLDSLSDLGRLVVNSTFGVGGLFDFASDMGMTKHDEDFGQTLGAWGVGSGPYMMLPFIGPSTLRDTAALPADSKTDPVNQTEHIPTRNTALTFELLDKRAGLMQYEDALKDVIDEYAFIRDIYLQNRKYKVLDGELPLDEECEEGFEEDCEF